MITIPLTKGCVTVIDDADLALVSMHKWHARRNHYRGMYAATNVRVDGPTRKYRTALMHRLLMGALQSDVIDHKNRDGLDNRRDNLRVANRSLNAANSKHRADRSTSQYRGVYLERDTGKYRSEIRVNGKLLRFGRHVDPVVAARLYDVAARKHFGEFAVVNFTSAQ